MNRNTGINLIYATKFDSKNDLQWSQKKYIGI